MTKTTTITKPFINFNDLLGEGPIYNPKTNAVYWIDAIGSRIHRVTLLATSNEIDTYTEAQTAEVTKSHQEISCEGEIVGSIGLTEDDDILAVTWTEGFGFANFKTLEFVRKPELPRFNTNPDLRLNDGIIDPHGNFWVGGMGKKLSINAATKSKLYRVNTDLTVDTMLEGVELSNGINFHTDKDGRSYLYYTDTLTLTLWRFDYDPIKRTISNRVPHIKITDHCEPGLTLMLDGFSMTEDGHIYTAVWGANRVQHFDEAGALVEDFVFPAYRVSSCSFVGPDRNELFVTTASAKLPGDDGCKNIPEDLGGACFRIKLDGVKGQLKDAVWGGSVSV